MVEPLLTEGPEFRDFLDRIAAPGGPFRRFPNGAVECDGTRVDTRSLQEALMPWDAWGGIEGHSEFKTLGPFAPKRSYVIHYPAAYQERLRVEWSFEVNQGPIRPPAPGEFDLDRLEVTVAFRSRATKAVRLAFVEAVARWAAEASGRGAFDDGPVALASPGVEFSATRARFLLDARRSGQDTLNWLALAALDFGEDVHPVTGIYFGSSPEFLDEMLGPARGEAVTVEFPAAQPVVPQAPAAPVRAGHVPADATLDSCFASRTFPVLIRPHDEWDSFRATVYFGRPLLAEEMRELTGLFDAWSRLGYLGGLGGRGIHAADPVAFDEATHSASMRADMGDADPEVALPVLIRSLEGFERGGPPIDALVFGGPAWWQTGGS